LSEAQVSSDGIFISACGEAIPAAGFYEEAAGSAVRLGRYRPPNWEQLPPDQGEPARIKGSARRRATGKHGGDRQRSNGRDRNSVADPPKSYRPQVSIEGLGENTVSSKIIEFPQSGQSAMSREPQALVAAGQAKIKRRQEEIVRRVRDAANKNRKFDPRDDRWGPAQEIDRLIVEGNVTPPDIRKKLAKNRLPHVHLERLRLDHKLSRAEARTACRKGFAQKSSHTFAFWTRWQNFLVEHPMTSSMMLSVTQATHRLTPYRMNRPCRMTIRQPNLNR
jgi:hypothetical protein